jgi:phage/plasmid-like protein (TIGR03299 family)
MSTRTATWAGIGTEVGGYNNNLEEILAASGLNYTVESRPVTIEGVPGVSERFHAIVRDCDNHVYNVAKKSYTICQNSDAFSLIEEMKDKVNIVKAGETESGLIYMIGELPEMKILGDNFKPHLILQNSHTADFALKSAIVPLRICCQNQFNLAFKEARSTHTIRHTSSINSAIQEAKIALRSAYDYLNVFEDQAERLALKKVDVNTVVNRMFEIPPEASARTVDNITANKEEFLRIYNNDDNGNFRGTAWGILNAATDYETHKPNTRSSAENRFVSTIAYPEFSRQVLSLVA